MLVPNSQPRVFARVLSEALLLTAALAAAGCDGTIDDTGSRPGWSPGSAPTGPTAGSPAAPSGPGSTSPTAADQQMQKANPSLFETAQMYFPSNTGQSGADRVFRLTRSQLDRTVQSLLPTHYKETVADSMPRDPLQTNYEYAAILSFNPANFTPYTNWVKAITDSVRANPSSVIDCGAQNNAASCLEMRAKDFTSKAFRGVATDAQVDRFAKFYVASVQAVGVPDATADLVDVTLTSPHFVFRDEVRTTTGVSVAARRLQNIAYTLTDAPPTALGMALDASSDAAVAQTIDRVLATPQAREKLVRFFTSWLEVREPDEFGLAPDLFPEFTPEVALAAVQSAEEFLKHQLMGAAPRLKDVTQSTQSYVSSALSKIYGTKGKSGTALALTDLDPEQRFGIFTHPAVIASHSGPTTTRLVKRGVFFTRKVMCLPLGNPPPGVNTTLPMVMNATERQRVETATASGTCLGCHAFINPFGFMQENYDPLGRWRTTDQGQPIDASIHVEFLDEGPLDSKTPIEALKRLTASNRFQQCFARQLFRFYTGRDEVAGDDPVLRQMFFGLANGTEQNVVDMLTTLARSASVSETEVKP